MTAKYNFTAGQGETFDRTVTWTIDDVAVNLTGYTARLQIRKTHKSTSAVVSLTQASGLTLGGSAGTIQIVISATATAALTDRTISPTLNVTCAATISPNRAAVDVEDPV